MQARSVMVRTYGSERYAAHVRATMARPDRSALLDGAIPTLVVTAWNDTVVPADFGTRYAAMIPGAHMHLVQGAGHLLPMECPAELADLLAAWVGAT